MKCPACTHENVSDFPFCEECLTLLPARPGNELAFELDVDTAEEPEKAKGWPPFPWNPVRMRNRLVGREKSLGELVDAWDQTVRSWTGRLHLLVSEFGMGKSQLSQRFAEEAIRREPQGLVVSIRCPERGGPYRMWDAVIRGLFEIGDTAGPSEAGTKLLAGVGQYLTDEVEEVAGVIADLLGYRLPGRKLAMGAAEGEAIVSRGAGALSRLLSAVAQEPFLLIITQANRGSSSSLALAGALEASLKDRPAMMVLSGTPELTRILRGWDRFPATHLNPLKEKHSREIVELFLTGLLDVPVELVNRIVQRGKGNPWAIKSLLHYLGEAGALTIERGNYVVDESVCWDLEWPEDLEGVVLARLGMLSSRDRSVLGAAAVVGSAFWSGALVAIERHGVEGSEEPGETIRDNLSWELSRSLERLAALRFIGRRGTEIPGEEAWVFRSNLHHRVASTIVPEATRARYHSVIEQWLRVHAGANPGHHLKELARHAELAGDRARAAEYNRRAARRALQNHHPIEAQTCLLQAEALVQSDNRPARMEIALALGDARVALGDFDGALASYQEALHMSWQLRHLSSGAEALMRIGKAETTAGRYDRAVRHQEASLRLFEQGQNRLGVAKVCLSLGKLFWLKGSHGEALQSYRKAERLFEELKDDRGLGDVADALASLHYDRGDLAQAERFYRRAIQLRNAIDDPLGVAAGLCNLGVAWLGQNKNERAIAAWQEALELATMIGNLDLQSSLGSNLGEVLLKLERYEEASEYLDKAKNWGEDGGSPRPLADIYLNRTALMIHRKEWKTAVTELERAQEISETIELPRVDGQVARMTGHLFLTKFEQADAGQSKHLKHAISHFRDAVTHFVEAGCYLEAAGTHDRLADALELAGKKSDAERERNTAAELRSAHDPATTDSDNTISAED